MYLPEVVENFVANRAGWGRIAGGPVEINEAMANMSIEDILVDADLNFEPKLVSTWIDNPFGPRIQSSAYSVVRADKWIELGKGFSDGYTPVSYLEALEGVFGDVKKLGGIPTRAIKFGDGGNSALQFILPDEWKIADRPHRTFFNLFAGFDGKTGIIVNTSDVCIVCLNTYGMARADRTMRFSAKHTKNVTARLAEIQKNMLALREEAKAYYMVLDKASTVKVNNDGVKAFIDAMLPPQEVKPGVRPNRARDNQRDVLSGAINTTLAEMNTSDVSAYALFAGVTRMISHKEQNRTPQEQFIYAMRSQLSRDAYAYVEELAK